eukprot:1161964-Pelagomonas_calceolata.AAC.6
MSESFCAENKSAQTCPASLPGPPAKQLAFVVSIKWLYPVRVKFEFVASFNRTTGQIGAAKNVGQQTLGLILRLITDLPFPSRFKQQPGMWRRSPCDLQIASK